MKNIVKSVLLVILLLALALLLKIRADLPEPVAATPSPTVAVTPTATPSPTPIPTPEPTPNYYTVSAIGDCTLTSHQMLGDSSPYSYAGRMQGDYSYPFSNTSQYFLNDDFTISNLECTLSDTTLYSPQQFYFRAPTAYASILINGGVDFVTTANNHSADFGDTGKDNTYAALTEYGIPFGKEDEAQLLTTSSGLVIGVYCAFNDYLPDTDKCAAAIASLREQGAEYIICAFHWGQELKYRPNQNQVDLARACIDAGANLVYGSHPHCLQPIEEYNGGVILYSMGNWSFGGNASPTDRDTAIVQIKVKRDIDGKITNDGYTIIPCCVSSLPVGSDNGADNDYKPTPYEEGSEEYERALSKITGTYQGPDGTADYSSWYSSYG